VLKDHRCPILILPFFGKIRVGTLTSYVPALTSAAFPPL